MKNTIAERINDFLKEFPPFSMLTRKQLLAISKSVDIHYLEKYTDLFIAGEPIENRFYVVKDGAIGLFRKETQALVDECDTEDIFGLRALMRKGNYKLSAKAIEESISSEIFEDYIATNPEVSSFLMTSFASNIRYIESNPL